MYIDKKEERTKKIYKLDCATCVTHKKIMKYFSVIVWYHKDVAVKQNSMENIFIHMIAVFSHFKYKGSIR